MPPRPFVQVGSAKIAPFKEAKHPPYGAFVNTGNDYPITQTITTGTSGNLTFKWTSSEEAFHAQKVIHLIQKMRNDFSQLPDPEQTKLKQYYIDQETKLIALLREINGAVKKIHTQTNPNPNFEFSPETYTQVVDDFLKKNQIFDHKKGTKITTKDDFDILCDADYHPDRDKQGTWLNTNRGTNRRESRAQNGEPYTTQFMRTVLELKFQQYPQIGQLAEDCASQGIIPVEISERDNNWGAGSDGFGANRLGVLILEIGNARLLQTQPHPQRPLPDANAAYQALQQTQVTQTIPDRRQRATPGQTRVIGELSWQELPAQVQLANPQTRPAATASRSAPSSSDPTSAPTHGHHPSSTRQMFGHMPPGQHIAGKPQHPAYRSDKAAHKATLPSLFTQGMVTPTDFNGCRQALADGKIPTVIETALQGSSTLPQAKKELSEILVEGSVKNVMRQLKIPFETKMVQNNRSGDTKKVHDDSAMQVKFNSQQEAAEFAKKLYENHGIHSFTLGDNHMKTPQQGRDGKFSIYLTKADLNTIAADSKLTPNMANSGNAAYDAIKADFKAKLAAEPPTSGSSFNPQF